MISLNLLQRGVQLFLQWAILQGVAMLLQNRYQRQRLYTRIALGKVLKYKYNLYAAILFHHILSVGSIVCFIFSLLVHNYYVEGKS